MKIVSNPFLEFAEAIEHLDEAAFPYLPDWDALESLTGTARLDVSLISDFAKDLEIQGPSNTDCQCRLLEEGGLAMALSGRGVLAL